MLGNVFHDNCLLLGLFYHAWNDLCELLPGDEQSRGGEGLWIGCTQPTPSLCKLQIGNDRLGDSDRLIETTD